MSKPTGLFRCLQRPTLINEFSVFGRFYIKGCGPVEKVERDLSKLPNGASGSDGANQVGPVIRHGELADAIVDAAEIDNPGKEIKVEDKVAYLRIQTEGEMILRRETIENQLGRSFSLSELEIDLASFAGRIDMGTEQVRFYFEKRL